METEHENTEAEDEAVTYLKRAFARRDPQSFFRDRDVASHKLLREVATAAADAGYEVSRDRSTTAIGHLRHGLVYLFVNEAQLVGAPDPKCTIDQWISFPIEFDPDLKSFVGSAEDTSRYPEPGKTRVRKSAVLAVCEVLSRAIDEQASRRIGG